MDQETIPQNSRCTSNHHASHLCHLMYEGFHFSHPQQYKEMVQDAHFRCQKCGRTAAQSEHLCEPVAL